MPKHWRNMHSGASVAQQPYMCTGPNCAAGFKREFNRGKYVLKARPWDWVYPILKRKKYCN